MNTRIVHELRDVDHSSLSWVEAMDLGFYQHEPLEDATRQIRLMRVLDGQWAEGKFIRCIVETFDLDGENRPPYEALSYVWEQPYPCWPLPTPPSISPSSRVVLVNGQRFHVRENLWRFLYRVRQGQILNVKAPELSYKHVHKAGHFWIDQICIDQTSSRERATQVQRMAEIFGSADRALVWLGDITPNSHAILSYLASTTFHPATSCVDRPDPIEGEILCNGLMHEFYELPYWKRLWVVQEFAIARDLILMWGQDYLCWDDFREAKWVEHINLIPEHRKYIGGVEEACDLRACHWQEKDYTYTNHRPRDSLFALMGRFRNQRSENVLDRVYSLLAVVPQEDQVTVSYEKEANEFFWEILPILTRTQGTRHSFSTILFKIAMGMGVTGMEKALQDPAVVANAKLAFGDGSEVEFAALFAKETLTRSYNDLLKSGSRPTTGSS